MTITRRLIFFKNDYLMSCFRAIYFFLPSSGCCYPRGAIKCKLQSKIRYWVVTWDPFKMSFLMVTVSLFWTSPQSEHIYGYKILDLNWARQSCRKEMLQADGAERREEGVREWVERKRLGGRNKERLFAWLLNLKWWTCGEERGRGT